MLNLARKTSQQMENKQVYFWCYLGKSNTFCYRDFIPELPSIPELPALTLVDRYRIWKEMKQDDKSFITLCYVLGIERELLYLNQCAKLNNLVKKIYLRKNFGKRGIFNNLLRFWIESAHSPLVGLFLYNYIFEVIFIFNFQPITFFEV